MNQQRTRRTELGRMLINASMYVVTGGIIGGFIAGKIDQGVGIVLFIAAILLMSS